MGRMKLDKGDDERAQAPFRKSESDSLRHREELAAELAAEMILSMPDDTTSGTDSAVADPRSSTRTMSDEARESTKEIGGSRASTTATSSPSTDSVSKKAVVADTSETESTRKMLVDIGARQTPASRPIGLGSATLELAVEPPSLVRRRNFRPEAVTPGAQQVGDDGMYQSNRTIGGNTLVREPSVPKIRAELVDEYQRASVVRVGTPEDKDEKCMSMVKSRKVQLTFLFSLFGVTCLVVGLIAGLEADRRSRSSDAGMSNPQNTTVYPSPTQAPSPSPVVEPAPAPTPNYAFFDFLAAKLDNYSLDLWQNIDELDEDEEWTPQTWAIDWIDSIPRHHNMSYKQLTQRYVLAVLYHSTDLDIYEGWLSEDDECTWQRDRDIDDASLQGPNATDDEIEVSVWGIACDGDALLEINLVDLGLTGTIPPELVLLSDMLLLELSANFFESTIPTELGMLTQLESLTLDLNLLEGTIPTELGDLTNLAVFDASRNYLSSTIPTELGRWENILQLIVDVNYIFGTIPSEVGLMTSLELLTVEATLITGTVPTELGRCTMLQELYLSNVTLTGTMPTELGLLTNLGLLFLQSSALTGTIPTEFGLLSGALWIDLSNNPGLEGPIPSEIGLLTELETLTWDNCKLNGTIPTSIGKLKKLQVLVLAFNSLVGTLPTELGLLEALVKLEMTLNEIEGPLPKTLASLSNLDKVFLDVNRVNGTLPPEYGDMTNLVELRLDENRLTGTVPPEYAAMTNLEVLYLFDNDISGRVSDSICSLVADHSLDGGLRVDCDNVECSCCHSGRGKSCITPQ